jgi:hypothetical protein
LTIAKTVCLVLGLSAGKKNLNENENE